MTAPNVTDATESQAPASAAPAEPAAPEYTGRDSISGMIDHSAEQHYTGKTLEALAAKGGELTAADLRQLPGAEGLTDEQLMAAWKELNPAPAAPPANATAAQKRAWKVYNGEVEVTDLKGMSAEDFLKMQFGYNANNKEQRRAFDEIVRNAQQGHYNVERMNQLLSERDTTLARARELESKNTEFTTQQKVWEQALNAASRGDYTPLQKVLDAYTQALNAAGQPQQPQQVPPGYVPVEQVQMQRAGEQVYQQTVLPKANELGQRYGLPQQEVADAIMLLVEREPVEFLTPQRFQQIVDIELPQHIENMMAQAGLQAPAAAAQPTDQSAEVARLQAELAALRGSQTEKANTRVLQLHQQRKTAPPAAAAVPGSSSGIESPDFEGGNDARNWLKNLK